MDPTKPTARHHGPCLPLPSLRPLCEQLHQPHRSQAQPEPGPINYAALRKRQAEARARSIQQWRERCDDVLRKPKVEGAVEPPLDAYVERTDGGTPYSRATPEYVVWFGRTYVVDVDTVTPPGGGAVQPPAGPGGGEIQF